ncbi:aminoacyl-tRNA hydrolase [Staphylococcus chromogenes]|nr:aminoacyl-tRNA hydrolase [Staphylococcus chromogenes]
MADQRFTPGLLEIAHRRLQLVLDPDRDGEDPARPETVQAMPIVLNIPKSSQPDRTALLEAAARAVVAACLDDRAGSETAYAEALGSWYGARIRKIARRARNTPWQRAQLVPGVTIAHGGAEARACVPSPVQDTDPALAKLQIGGTDLPASAAAELRLGVPLIVVDAGLAMSVGKAAAQVGHGSMLLAAHMPLDWVTAWAATGFDLQVRELPTSEFREVCAQPGAVLVQDAGYTEVAPGSVTVAALPTAQV